MDHPCQATADELAARFALSVHGDGSAKVSGVATLAGAGNGQLARNGYYRVAIGLTGLTGQDVTASITVAPWETPVTQNINIGI